LAREQLTGNRYLCPGTKVRLDSLRNGSDEPTSEYGIVVHCWEEAELDFFDCYVAFFGDGVPTGKPAEKPYVLKYAAISLTTIL
jgi:hypothetical protein